MGGAQKAVDHLISNWESSCKTPEELSYGNAGQRTCSNVLTAWQQNMAPLIWLQMRGVWNQRVIFLYLRRFVFSLDQAVCVWMLYFTTVKNVTIRDPREKLPLNEWRHFWMIEEIAWSSKTWPNLSFWLACPVGRWDLELQQLQNALWPLFFHFIQNGKQEIRFFFQHQIIVLVLKREEF